MDRNYIPSRTARLRLDPWGVYIDQIHLGNFLFEVVGAGHLKPSEIGKESIFAHIDDLEQSGLAEDADSVPFVRPSHYAAHATIIESLARSPNPPMGLHSYH